MTKSGEETYVVRCLRLIEAKLSWGSSVAWTNYDFEKLSDIVHDSTGVRLSVTTLKRLWGRLKYESAPTLTTLNTLAQFAGYADWRSFKQMQAAQNEEPVILPVHEDLRTQEIRSSKKKISPYWLALIIPFLLACYLFIAALSSKPDPDQFIFEANKMLTEGVPNSVVFHYDAHAAGSDSVFITQNWDISRKKRVSKNGTDHSSIYYYPGYFRAQLIIDGYTVKTQDVWITSDGWLCLAEGDPMPVYFNKTEYMVKDQVEVDEALLKKYNLSLNPRAPKLRFYNQRDLGDVMNDNFIFETKLKNTFHEGANACQEMQVLLHCKNDVMIIPLAAKGCVGNLFISFCGIGVNSKDTDLSKFGADLTQWTKLRVESVDKHFIIYVNDLSAYEGTFPNDINALVGVQYRFNGVGAVKETYFESKGKVIRL